MEQYISKSALVAKIERLKADVLQKKEQCKRKGLEKIMHQIGVYNKVLSLINALEVEEVDLDFTKEVDVWVSDNGDTNGFFNVQELAKHFFELGLKAKGE